MTVAIQRARSKAGSSRMERARMLAGPQVEALEQLSMALEDLREAERGHQLPNMINASVQVGIRYVMTIPYDDQIVFFYFE